jgi:mRNA-degrading endonuclease RelE of RelBE toxin-antitoxin system
MDVRFHCSHRVRRSGKRSRHDVFGACGDICKVLKLHPDYRVPIPGFLHFRKMRLMVPGLASGKSGGYRLIYRKQVQDETLYIVFLETYFNGDREDLSRQEYKTLAHESEAILSSPLSFDWSDG